MVPILVSGCGLGEYEERLKEERARVKLIEQERLQLGEPVDAPQPAGRHVPLAVPQAAPRAAPQPPPWDVGLDQDDPLDRAPVAAAGVLTPSRFPALTHDL